ncbi:MAG: hypothetical protein K0R57_4192 [Paenibacillaceae bacterium]|jgi:signal transduction histidine kinase|nr:hypothetical protein [Paenibacillaceae bacterium]
MTITRRRLVVVTVSYLLILTVFQMLWVRSYSHSGGPVAQDGLLDLRNEHFTGHKTFNLDGKWEFYPNQLLSPEALRSASHSRSLIQVPDGREASWEAFPEMGETNYAYGTYRLRLLVNSGTEQLYGLIASEIRTASRIFVNGELAGESGTPAASREYFQPRNIPYSVSFAVDKDEVEIVIQVSHLDYSKQAGGLRDSIIFGSEQAIGKYRTFFINMQLTVLLILLLHLVYIVLLYLFGTRQKVLVTFFLLIVFSIISLLVDDDKLLLARLPLNYEWSIKLLFLSYTGVFTFIMVFIAQLLPQHCPKRVIRLFAVMNGIYALAILLSPLEHLHVLSMLFSATVYFPAFAIPVILFRAVWKGEHDAIFLLLATVSILSNLLWGALKSNNLVEDGFYPFDFIFAFLGFASYWFSQYFRNAEQTAQLAKRLQKADRQKDDFLANTSHELRNPLHGIINIAQTVLDGEKTKLAPKNVKNMEMLITIGRRMSFMLNDLLDLAQLRESNIRLEIAALRVQPVISGVMDMLKFMTEGKPIRLVMNIPDDFPLVAADEKRLIQIVFNLLHNAFKYTIEGSVTIYGDVQGQHVHIHVADTGIGMDDETLVRIFQPYEQADSGIAAIGGGLGLGLSICRELVELHGGVLTVRSSPGQGSIFTFTLPIAKVTDGAAHASRSGSKQPAPEHGEDREHESTDQQAPAAVSGRPRVMVVDDDPVNLLVLRGILSDDQYEIVTATSGEEAVGKLDEGQWNLIIADVMMPHMSGYELAGIVRKRFSISELPILLLTARSLPADIDTGFAMGANDYVSKPVDALELKARVRALTDLGKSVSEQLRLEGAYLQAQIQPHFLFNAMSAISALGDIDVERMRRMIDAFSAYLRISFDYMSAERLVPAEYELELVRAYLYIEKERFEERLEIEWELPCELNFLLPPLSIQPLVENAVRHGILSRSRGGRIVIGIKHVDKGVEISIKDNGVGINPERMEQILVHQPNTKRGIGLVNTDRRLKQLYGRGLHITSEPDIGTTVSFVIPGEASKEYSKAGKI